MKEIIFGSCTGEEFVNPEYDAIRSLIEAKGAEYWCIDSGQSVLRYEEESIKKTLYIMMSEGYGFYLEYVDDTAYYVPLSGNSFDDVTDIYIGGDPIKVPREMFLDIKNTIIQIKAFFKSGKVANNVNWVNRSNINWDYGVPSSNEENKKVFKSIDEIILENKKRRRKRKAGDGF